MRLFMFLAIVGVVLLGWIVLRGYMNGGSGD
jgi:hypothetical protein